MFEKGNVFPDFEYLSYDGKAKDLYTELGQSPAAILFLRYIGCTKCRLDVHELLTNKEKLLEKGIRVFLIFQSEASVVKEEIDSFPFEIICDPEQRLYRRFEVLPAKSKEELLDFEHFGEAHDAFRKAKTALGLDHGKYEGNELQKPAIFLLDADKKIVFSHYAGSLMDMPSVEKWISMF
jgi:peroxiredoxin